ncbi:MAG: TIGR03960 family B12-binding radical SAM protein, partial [Chitinivibrionales bacterium]
MTLEKNLFPYVKKPFRYTGGELNSVVKNPSETVLSGVLCFPEIYDIGMSHFGSSILYNIVNNKVGWEMKRCYHPANDAEAIMRRQDIPLYALEDLRPVSENHWLGFTVQYELQYTNILNMLDLSRIPLFSDRRPQEDPLVIAGGPCIANPEPLSAFIDVFSFGDGEVSLPDILDMLQEGNASGESRLSILRRINTIENVYVPLLEEREQRGLFRVPDAEKHIKAAKTSELKEEYYSCRPVVPLLDVVHHRLASEVMRGCSRGCRFCSAGYIYRPVRERAPSDILNSVKAGADNTGWRDVTLLSLSTADHSGIEEILEGVNYDKDRDYSFPSTRADALSEERLETLLKKTGTSSFTIAPEAGTERLRRIINKDFTDETVVETSYRLFARGVKTIKLYFMIGLPMERDEDIEGIWRLVERVHRKAKSVKGKRSINLSLSPFTPKPHTPFQREAFNDPETLREKSETVLRNLKKYRDIKISYRNPYMSCLETILSRGDRDVCRVIHRAWEKGALFDGWDDSLEFTRWEEAADDLGIDFSKYLREIPEKEILPWSFADYGITDAFLKAEIERAKKGERTPDCRYERCSECGVCVEGLRPFYKKSSLSEIPGSVRGLLSEE